MEKATLPNGSRYDQKDIIELSGRMQVWSGISEAEKRFPEQFGPDLASFRLAHLDEEGVRVSRGYLPRFGVMKRGVGLGFVRREAPRVVEVDAASSAKALTTALAGNKKDEKKAKKTGKKDEKAGASPGAVDVVQLRLWSDVSTKVGLNLRLQKGAAEEESTTPAASVAKTGTDGSVSFETRTDALPDVLPREVSEAFGDIEVNISAEWAEQTGTSQKEVTKQLQPVAMTSLPKVLDWFTWKRMNLHKKYWKSFAVGRNAWEEDRAGRSGREEASRYHAVSVRFIVTRLRLICSTLI